MRTLLALLVASTLSAAPPNVLIVITDDQGWGDLGAHGNPILKTPHLDAFAKESVWLKNFSVCPVCSPTRSSLLSGFYNYRTGVVDTHRGRSMMRPDVVTLPQTLAKKGYRTGLFGKWHLGDHYPLRPEDRGFQHTLWLHGGGLHQPSDHPDTDPKTAYFDAMMVKDTVETKTKGYCSDVITDGAIDFIQKSQQPFFAYVAYNAPHAPYQVPDADAEPYRKLNIKPESFPKLGQPWVPAKFSEADTANAYGMIANLDNNFARLMKTLKDKGIDRDTIVVFLTDNGPGGPRWNGGLRNRKGTVYEGGIRVPCYVRYPAKLEPHTLPLPMQHVDLAPTIDGFTGGDVQTNYDGLNRSNRLINPTAKFEDAHRILFTQWHRGDVPEKYRCFMARDGDMKLVQSVGAGEDAKWKPKFELFDLSKDEFEQNDLAAAKPEVVERLKGEYAKWFDDVTKKGFEPPRIIVGGKENPLRLSWQDRRAEWAPNTIGDWHLEVQTAGQYQITFQSKKDFDRAKVVIDGTSWTWTQNVKSKTLTASHELKKGPLTIKPVLEVDGKTFGPDWVTVELR